MSRYITNDFALDIAQGRILKYSAVSKFGHNEDLDLGVEEDIWIVGGTYVFPSDSGEALEIVSSNAGDTSSVIVEGLDENFNQKSETVTLTGTTAINLSGLWARVHRMYVDDATAIVGNVDVRDQATSLVIYARIRAEEQQTAQCIYTIPNGFTGYLIKWALTMNGPNNGNADVALRVRPFGKVFLEKDHRGLRTASTSVYYGQPAVPIRVEAKTDIKLSGEADANNVSVAGCFDIILVADKPGS